MVRPWLLAACLAGGLSLTSTAVLADPEPRRVLSMNLCTDQLAMLLAAPGQLISVSYLARDPASSVMADQAAVYPVNHARAEEIFLMRPDLVLTGTYSAPATQELLRRLGIPVVSFDAEMSMADIRANLIRMGEVLGRHDAAAEAVARFDADLALLSDQPGPNPRAASYSANSYTSGRQSLAGEIIATAGFDNIAEEFGLAYGGTLPLELLMLATPDLIVTAAHEAGTSRSEEVLNHPGLKALLSDHAHRRIADRDWVCGTPHVLRAVAGLIEARKALQ